MAVTGNTLNDVSISLHLYNEITSTEAINYILDAAAVGAADNELIPANAYLFLSDAPEKDSAPNSVEIENDSSK